MVRTQKDKDMEARSFHPNPSVQRGRLAALKDLAGPSGGGEEGGGHPHEQDVAEHGPVHEASVESKGGKHTVVAHHQDGHVGRHEHADLESAHAHHAAIMGGGSAEHQPGENPNAENPDEQSEPCPSCGGEMVDGKCQTCGYEQDAGEGSGAEEHEQ